MQFTFGRRESGDFVIERAWPVRDQNGSQIGVTPALRIEYYNGLWDSEAPSSYKAYRDYVNAFNATHPKREHTDVEKVRERCEKHLLNHPDFGKVGARRIHKIDTTIPESIVPKPKCSFIKVEEDGASYACVNDALEDSDTCALHARQEAVA